MGQVIDIGFYKNESDWLDVDMETVKKHEGMAHEVNYVEGSRCDLTNKPRRATAKVSLLGHPACYVCCACACLFVCVCCMSVSAVYMYIYIIL